MSVKSCISINTPEIQQLAATVGLPPAVVTDKVGVWQDKNNTDRVPTVKELQDYIKLYQQNPTEKLYSDYPNPITRKSRATLIASLFVDIIDEEVLQLQKGAEEVGNYLSRKKAISLFSPIGAFNKVKSIFQDALNDTEEQLSEYETIEYQKIIDNFYGLFQEASSQIRLLTGLSVSVDYNTVQDYTDIEVDEEGNTSEDYMLGTQDNAEETQKEGWQINFHHQSAKDSLSQEVRSLLQRIIKVNSNNQVEYDDLGFVQYVSADTAHETLIDKLKVMTKSSDLIPILEGMKQNYPWVQGIIDKLQEDESVKSKFYQDFRKDAINFYIQKRYVNKNGGYSYETIPVNKPTRVTYLIGQWKDNTEQGLILTDSSVYNKNGSANIDNINSNLQVVRNLISDYVKTVTDIYDTSQVISWVDNNLSTVQDLLRSIGVNISDDILKDAMTASSIKLGRDVKVILPAKKLLEDISGALSVLSNQKFSEDRVDFPYILKGYYNNIANRFSKVLESEIESAFRENGKSYYSHVVPSYLGKLVKELKNSFNNSERFQEFMNKEFKRFDFFYSKGQYRSSWLRDLNDSQKYRDLFDHQVLLNLNKVNYADQDDLTYQLSLINNFFTDTKGNSAWYNIPVLSDAPSGEFIRFRRFTDKNSVDEFGNIQTYKQYLLDRFYEVALQEYSRIQIVNKRKSLIEQGKIQSIENFDGKGGDRFQFFPLLNEYLNQINDIVEGDSSVKSQDLRDLIKPIIEESINIEFQKAIQEWESTNLLQEMKDPEGKVKGLTYLDISGVKTKEQALVELENYFWNSAYATTQIIQLTTSDVAFYKNIEDFQKRNKQIHSPALRLNTDSKYGRQTSKTVYLKDSKGPSNVLKEITEFFNTQVQRGLINPETAKSIIDGYKKVNATDAQAYRSLSSYKAVMDMAGKWTPSMDRLFNKIQKTAKGLDVTFDQQDYEVMWQTIKPFVFTQVATDSHIIDKEGNSILVKTPVQNKNSEMLLLPLGIIAKSPKLMGIYNFMEDNNIDVVQFESTVKVGKQGVLDINNLNDAKQIQTYLESRIGDPEVIHELPYDDYGIQQQVPEHLLDAANIYGTQIRKLITADISQDAEFELPGYKGKLSKAELLKLYNNIITTNLKESFDGLLKEFKDPKQLEKILLEEVKGNPRYGSDIVEACTLNKDGEFTIPLFEPIQSLRIQSLLNSIIKSRVTKQKIKGGTVVLASSFGTEDLQIVFETDENSNKRIKHIECYMPWYSRQYFQELIDPKTGTIDINKIQDEDLRKLVGYRIPTEDKYSMAPLYIKGFLPQWAGGVMMLPADMTLISGEDFDIDKRYLMIPEFRMSKQLSKKEIIKNFKKSHPELTKDQIDIAYQEIINGQIQFSEDSYEMELLEYYESIPSIPKKIRPQYDKPISEWTLQERNNALLDMTYSVLTNKDTTEKILNPGGFDNLKKAARITTILSNISTQEAKKLAGDPSNLYQYLESLSLDKLDSLFEKYKGSLSYVSPRTWVRIQQQNTIAGKLIGVAANHNTNHALLQNLEVSIKPNNLFKLGGKVYSSLSRIKNDSNQFISKNNSSYLASFVDAVKDPVPNYLNINTFTADTALFLSRLGHEPNTIALLLTQPIIQELVQYYNQNVGKGKDKQTILEEYTRQQRKDVPDIGEIDFINTDLFSLDNLSKSLMQGSGIRTLLSKKPLAEFSQWEIDKYNRYRTYQFKVLSLFNHIFKSSQALANLTSIMRSDSSNAGAGPYISSTQDKILKVDKFNRYRDMSPLVMNFRMDTNTSPIDKDILDALENNNNQYAQSFFTFGIMGTEDLLGNYFMQYKSEIKDLYYLLSEQSSTGTISDKVANDFYNELLIYVTSQLPFFGGSPETLQKKREYYLEQFPSKFAKLKGNADLQNYNFIKKLDVTINQNTNKQQIVFRNVGALSQVQKDEYQAEWNTLLQDPKYQPLAYDLFLYSYFRNGFAFGPNSFSHLAPIQIRQSIPNYVSLLRDMLGSEVSIGLQKPFIQQFIMNHLNNKQLVPIIDGDSSNLFIRDNKPTEVVTLDKGTIDSNFIGSIVLPNEYTAREVIQVNNNDSTYYYALVDSVTNGEDKIENAIYQLVDPINDGSYITYGYGQSILDFKPVKDYNPEPVDTVESQDSFELPQNIYTSKVDYNELVEAAAQYGLLPDATIVGEQEISFDFDTEAKEALDQYREEKRDNNEPTLCKE